MTRKRKIWSTILSIVGVYLVYLLIASAVNMHIQNTLQPKVREGLTVSLQVTIENGPRNQWVNGQYTYYLPDTNNLGVYYIEPYKDTLIQVNQDVSSPICKITQVNLSQDSDTLYASANVIYPGFLGIPHTFGVQVQMKSPDFKNPTGDAHY